MHNRSFDLRLLSQKWIRDNDDATDLCTHGNVYLRIADKVLSDDKDGDWTTSATALNLMRTLEKNYIPGEFASQLIPCCGFDIYATGDGSTVDICGCPTGIDWTIRHESSYVIHIADTGEQAIIPIEEYRKIVFLFADSVALFYHISTPKIPGAEQEHYEAFWKEWNNLRYKHG